MTSGWEEGATLVKTKSKEVHGLQNDGPPQRSLRRKVIPVTDAAPGTTVATELVEVDASREIAKAVTARHSIARKYVLWLRRRHPDATPAEIVELLERHYGSSITTGGAAVAAIAIAAEVAIGLIPGGGSAAAGAKAAGKGAAKAAAKKVALGAAKAGARGGVALIPAGDAQLQFEITAVFALAIADVHGMQLDKEQAQALVYGLSNGRVSQELIATMAADVANTAPEGVVGVGHKIAEGRSDWSHWASTLADALPGGRAQSLVRTIQTGQLNTVRENLNGKQRAAIEYGMGALVGGVTRFVFGQEVIAASRKAFPVAPDDFPAHLSEVEPSRALIALKKAAKSNAGWVSGTAGRVGAGVANGAAAAGGGAAAAASALTRPFRSVDLDGDGVPDDPQALTLAKDVGSSIAGAAGSVRSGVAKVVKPKKRE
jgi:hypothetical protein